MCDKEVRKIFLEYSKLQQVIVMNLSVAGKEVRQVKIIFLEYSKLQQVSKDNICRTFKVATSK